MSAIPARELEIWRSSLAESITPISGAFSFEVLHTGMVPQTLQFLSEESLRWESGPSSEVVLGLIRGMRYADPSQPGPLLFWHTFCDAAELFAFDLERIAAIIRQLEIHADINLTYGRVSFLADVGRGPELPLLVVARRPIARGIAFEIDERAVVRQSLAQGDFVISNKVMVAQQHYSTGMAMLAAEDAVAGLIDAAFMQFYLAIEAILEEHEKVAAIEACRRLFGTTLGSSLERIISHVYVARHRFFGHAHPRYLRGMLDTETAFDIAKQALVARWCARRLLELELGRPLVTREMRLYPQPNRSVMFTGNSDDLDGEFALPA